jgi:hypothetical protein
VPGKKIPRAVTFASWSGQATSTPAGPNTLTTVSGGFAVQLFLLVNGVVVARLLGVEGGHLAFTESLR